MSYPKATYEECIEFNNLPEAKFDIEMDPKLLPTFILDTVNSMTISNPGAIKFLNKFAYYYVTEDFVKPAFNGYVFLILDRDYIGVFPNREDAYRYINDNNIKYSDIFIREMYPPVYYEYNCLSVSTQMIIYLNSRFAI